MASGRMINNSMWQSEKLTALSLRHRMLWIGLITTSDDQGRGRAHPGLIRATVFPLEDVTLDEIRDGLAAFAEQGMIALYDAEDKAFYQITKWWDYQGAMRWAWPSVYPPPPDWQDRIKHRRGNNVVEEHWEQDDPDATATSPRPHDDLTLTPQGESALPAPNINGNINGNINSNGNGNEDAGAPSPETIRSLVENEFPELRLSDGQIRSLLISLDKNVFHLWQLEGALGWARTNNITRLSAITKAAMGWRATGPPRDNGTTAAQRAAEAFIAEEEE